VKITGLEVDGYGVWTGLKLDPLSGGLNVFFGPNEAGKTTLIQFVRSVLYGFTPERRRYLPPVGGGRPGGSVCVDGPNGRFQVSRFQADGGTADGDTADDEIALEAPDGTRQGGHLLKVLLSNIDEAIFNNVFAVGLDELHQLATLDDTEAASLLYSLSAGLDRVALVDVLRELDRSRNRLLSADGKPCQVVHLLAERDKLREEIGELDGLAHRYLRLAAERKQLERETTRLEEEANQLRHQARVIEIAAVIGDRWERRKQLDDQLAALGPIETLPQGAAEQLDAVTAALAKGADRMGHLRRAWDQLRAEAAELKGNEALWRLAPRIEALAEQASWIGSLQTRSSELETEITDLEAQLSAEQERLGLGNGLANEPLPSISARSLRMLRGPAREVRQCRQRVEEAEGQATAARETARSLAGQIDAALSARGETDLARAMDRVGGLVAQLRRRVQLDQRLVQMDRHQAELEEESRHLLGRQVLPAGLLMALGGVFVTSVMMILAGLAGLLVSESIAGSLAWPLALLGLAGLGAGVATKLILERSNARRLEGCQKQVSMLRLQINEAKQERHALDEQLSISDASVAGRLRAAEEELDQLEQLVPIDARRKAAEQAAETAEVRGREAEGELDAARRRWQEALHTLGLPKRLSPKQVRDLATRSTHVDDLRRRLESRYEEYEARRHELETLTNRITQWTSEAGLPLQSKDPIEQVHALARQLSEEEVQRNRREALRAQARQLRRKRTKYQQSIRRLKYRRHDILRRVGADDERQFRQRAAQVARAAELRHQRDSLAREIDAAIAGHCPEQAIAEQLEGDMAEHLDRRYEQVEKRLQATEARLQKKLQQRGTLSEQLRAVAEDRRPAVKQLELALVEQRLNEAIHRWRVLAVTSRVLRSIRTRYEQERQPETLQEASALLERLTEGRYVRVWTPLDRDVLLVDNAQGKSLPIELLSRGVREQLFLCLRLALSSSFARRGARLPLLLDDVLVNFDSRRAKAAVGVLRDFAAAGHQVLVFTCHEHLVRLFRSLRVQVNALPDSRAGSPARPTARRSAKTRRKARPEPPPLTPPTAVPEEPPHKIVAVSHARHASEEPQSSAVDPHEKASPEPVPREEVKSMGRPDVPRYQPATWETVASHEPEEEAGAADVAAVADDQQDGQQPYAGYPGYYDAHGSYDDRGIEIANHLVPRNESGEEIDEQDLPYITDEDGDREADEYDDEDQDEPDGGEQDTYREDDGPEDYDNEDQDDEDHDDEDYDDEVEDEDDEWYDADQHDDEAEDELCDEDEEGDEDEDEAYDEEDEAYDEEEEYDEQGEDEEDEPYDEDERDDEEGPYEDDYDERGGAEAA
jgi:uncharacterized protein YhaN